MQTKKCSVEKKPEPSPPDPCKLQRRREKEKAGIKLCPPAPIEEPPQPPRCLGICIEKIKNPDYLINTSNSQHIVCVVEREITGTARCDEIENAVAAHPDLPWPGCPPQPELPLPPKPDLCELQRKREKAIECKERMKRYFE